MSLEEALAANTAALIANTAALGGQAAPAKATKKAAAAAEAPAPAPAATPAPNAASAPAAATVAAATGPSFKEVADALVELVTKKSRDVGVALLAEFGATKVPELKPADYAAFIAKAKGALAPAAPAVDSSGLL